MGQPWPSSSLPYPPYLHLWPCTWLFSEKRDFSFSKSNKKPYLHSLATILATFIHHEIFQKNSEIKFRLEYIRITRFYSRYCYRISQLTGVLSFSFFAGDRNSQPYVPPKEHLRLLHCKCLSLPSEFLTD
jgi:hypothetical protein